MQLQDHNRRRSKPGARIQLQAKIKDAQLLACHSLSRQHVKKGLSSTQGCAVAPFDVKATRSSSNVPARQLARRLLSKSPEGPLLIEWCCSKTSSSASLWSNKDYPAFRVTLPDWDALAPRTFDVVMALIDVFLEQAREERV